MAGLGVYEDDHDGGSDGDSDDGDVDVAAIGDDGGGRRDQNDDDHHDNFRYMEFADEYEFGDPTTPLAVGGRAVHDLLGEGIVLAIFDSNQVAEGSGVEIDPTNQQRVGKVYPTFYPICSGVPICSSHIAI